MKHASVVGAVLVLSCAVVSASSLDKSIIRKPIKAKLPAFRACYEKALEKNPKLEGTVSVKFVIGTSGQVLEATATGLPLVNECVANVMKTIVFPKSSSGHITVNYPFSFSPAR
jgi:outer membrane biosynthesis protein TonB